MSTSLIPRATARFSDDGNCILVPVTDSFPNFMNTVSTTLGCPLGADGSGCECVKCDESYLPLTLVNAIVLVMAADYILGLFIEGTIELINRLPRVSQGR